MMKIKNKIIKGGIVISIITLLVVPFHLVYKKDIKEESKISLNTENLISYTIDGEMAKEKPTKDSGYIASKITCKNNSNIVWDNDNWQVEMNAESLDRCTVDFTKDTTREGYRVTVTSNDISALDSTSKTTINGGTVIIYPKGSTIASVTGCSGVLEDNKVIVRNVTGNQSCNITIKKSTLAEVIIESESNIVERTDFSNIETTAKLWKTTDYDASGSFTGTSYYYTGNPDNWVSFAGNLWRIIRVNGDGSVRLLYAGSGGADGYVGSPQYYATSSGAKNNPAYVGWKYSTSGTNGRGTTTSYAYQTVKRWYDGLSTTNKAYINTSAKYCADRTASTDGSASTNTTTFKAADNLSTMYTFGAYWRVVGKNTPSLICESSDTFTDGFGLMTADEVVYAGGVYETNNSSAYYDLNVSGGKATGTHRWWTMTPRIWSGSNALTFDIYGSGSQGYLGYDVVDGYCVVRPVVSLKAEVVVTGGNGTGTDPYTVSL